MRASLKIFTWLGIPVYLHWSFALILLFPAFTFVSSGFSWQDTALHLAILISLFTCVLLHEYGHAIMARRFGVSTRDIILTPIGGIARLERMPERPVQEILVAIAGPLVNVVIAALLLLGSKLLLQPEYWDLFVLGIEDAWSSLLNYFNFFGEPIETAGVLEGDAEIDMPFLPSFAFTLIILNAMLVIFNMVPAFPMDGGRVFRALVALRAGRVRATRIAASVGQIVAGFFLFLGIFQGPPSLMLIGVFIFITARSENAMVQMDDLLSRFTARDLVRRNFSRFNTHDWMQMAIDSLPHGLERNFLVFDLDDRLAGMLEEQSILQAARNQDRSAAVAKYMEDVPVIPLNTPLQHVYQLIRQHGNGILAVSDEYSVVGVIDEEGLMYFLRLQSGNAGKSNRFSLRR
ncbi:MAG: site-2 protease family protein [Chitinophagales bacterium]|jgi:Zn-dependent protease/predicted transcriptional regulator|nr:site-2 protease family protein [Chitinophagales bacterium]